MSLLLDQDYEYLKETGLSFVEDEPNRYFIITNYPVQSGLYTAAGQPIDQVEVLVMIPSNYNMTGGDMFWTYPALTKADGTGIINVMAFGGGDARFYDGKEYCRWSRHFDQSKWKPKIDGIEKILARIEWALKNPDARR